MIKGHKQKSICINRVRKSRNDKSRHMIGPTEKVLDMGTVPQTSVGDQTPRYDWGPRKLNLWLGSDIWIWLGHPEVTNGWDRTLELTRAGWYSWETCKNNQGTKKRNIYIDRRWDSLGFPPQDFSNHFTSHFTLSWNHEIKNVYIIFRHSHHISGINFSPFYDLTLPPHIYQRISIFWPSSINFILLTFSSSSLSDKFLFPYIYTHHLQDSS